MQDCLQNGVVAGVAPAVGAADDHTVPGFPGPVVAADDLPVDVQLGVHRVLDGELGGGLLEQLLAQLMAQGVVIAHGGQVAAQGFPIAGLEQIAVHVRVDEIGDAAHGGGHGGQMEPGALRQGVGEGLGQGGQGVDVQRTVKPVHAAADPAGKRHLLFHAQLLGEILQLFPLLAVAGDDQPQPGTPGIAGGKATHQRGHILDGVQTGGDAHHHAVLVHIRA